MNITRDVILDLLPLYLAGEGSAATRELVEEYLQQDAEIARIVRTHPTEPATQRAAPVEHDLELRSLIRTRRLLGIQRWFFALAIMFTALSLTTRITLQGHRVSSIDLLVLDYPLAFGGMLMVALGCWIGYFALRRRLRSTFL
jgi:hypothetical protein